MPTVAWLVTASLVGTRLAVVLSFLPVLSMKNIPSMVRALLTLGLTMVITPGIAGGPIPSSLPTLVLGIGAEVLMGVLIGGTIRLAYDSLSLAGQVMDGQTGQAGAVAFDPNMETTQGPLSLMASLLAGAVFLGADMHLEVLTIVADSFRLVAPGAVARPLDGALPWFDLSGAMMVVGFRLAAPTIGLIFLINMFVAAITKLAPQLNIYFSFGFILTIFGGELVWITALPHVLTHHQTFVRQAIETIPEVIGLAGGRSGG